MSVEELKIDIENTAEKQQGRKRTKERKGSIGKTKGIGIEDRAKESQRKSKGNEVVWGFRCQ